MCHWLTNLNQFCGHLVYKSSISFQVLTILVSRGRHPYDHDPSCVYVAEQEKGSSVNKNFSVTESRARAQSDSHIQS